MRCIVIFLWLILLGSCGPRHPNLPPPYVEPEKIVKTENELPEDHLHAGVHIEGPRRFARLLFQENNIHRPVCGLNEFDQALFDQGLEQLYGFWNYEAERSFHTVASRNPDCAMAFWGLSMANIIAGNGIEEHAQKWAKIALEKIQTQPAKISRDDRTLVESLSFLFFPENETWPTRRKAFVDFMHSAARTSSDPEIKVFYVEFARYFKFLSKDPKDPDFIESREMLDQVISQAKGGKHPAHHIRIHLLEVVAPEAIDSASLIGPSSPSIAHMWHMAGHIYDHKDVNRWTDASLVQEISARMDSSYMRHTGVMPYEIHNYAHNNAWLTRSYIKTGGLQRALEIAKNLIVIPRHPKLNRVDMKDSAASLGPVALVQAWSTYELWNAGCRASPQLLPLNDPSNPEVQFRSLHFASIACLLSGQKSDELISRVRNFECDSTSRCYKNVQEEKKIAIQELNGLERYLEAKSLDVRRNALESIFKIEGDIKWKIMTISLPRLALRSGLDNLAVEWATAIVANHPYPIPALLQLLSTQVTLIDSKSTLVDESEAEKTWDKIREISLDFDLQPGQTEPESPLLKVVWNIQHSDVPYLKADDRIRSRNLTDITRQFPILDQTRSDRMNSSFLGDIIWSPRQTKKFEAVDIAGTEIIVGQKKRDRPLMIVFSRGTECVACNEQLHALRDRWSWFQNHGLEIIVVVEQDENDIKTKWKKYPFPAIADPTHRLFKLYDAVDDFATGEEPKALHGIFLIGKDNQVLWKDLNDHAVVADLDVVLGEFERLLTAP